MATPTGIDLNDLKYYDSQIKKYIDDRDAEIQASLPDISNIDEKLDKISEDVAVISANIVDLKDHINENEAAILILQADDKKINDEIADLRVIVENKLDESAMAYLATKEYVQSEIEKIELDRPDVDLSNYYTKAETDAKLDVYATKDYVTSEISKAINVDFSDYYTKDEVDNQISEIADSLNAYENIIGYIPISDKSLVEVIDETFVKKEDLPSTDELVTKEYVEEHVTEQVANIIKINYGEF